MGLDNLYADISARYARLNQSLAKGKLGQSVSATLSHQYAYPVSKDGLGMAQLGAQSGTISDNCVPFVVSTQDVDRDGDIVISRGGDLVNYAKNPIVYFGHGSWQVPIGVARKSIDSPLEVSLEDRLVRANAYFDMPDPDAAFIFGKVERGILNATSISFLPILAHQRERGKSQHDDMRPTGWVFERWELTEFSIVAVPANAGALRDAYDSEKSFITPRLQKALAPYCAQAKGRCFTGYCPCPPCEDDMSKTLNADKLKSGLHSGLPKKKKCKCGGKCQTCKSLVPDEDTGTQADGDNEGEHAHEESQANSIHEAVAAKLPMLTEAGYDEAQAGAIAHHLAGKGVEGIEGHEEVARALGYKKDEVGGDSGAEGGEEQMGLKAYLGSIRKSEDDKPEPKEKPAESSSETDEEPEEDGPQFKGAAKTLGFLHNHMKDAHEFLTKDLETMDHPAISKAMTHHLKDLTSNMESYKELHDQHYPDNNFEKMCKSLDEGGEGEEVEEETGADGADEATAETDKPEADNDDRTGQEVIREDYNHKSKRRSITKAMDHGCVSAASMCMKEIAGDGRVSGVHKAALMHHSGALDQYCKGVETPVSQSEPVAEGLGDEAMKRVTGFLEKSSNWIFEHSGQRI